MSDQETEGMQQKAVLAPLISRVRKILFTTSSSGRASGVLTISSMQFSEWNRHIHCHADSPTSPWIWGQEQSHSVGLQARAVTHHLSSILTSILKLKVIGMNSDAGTHAFGMNYQHIYPCIPLHPLVRGRLKAATCIQKINCQITLLLQPAATVTQKITKAHHLLLFLLSEKNHGYFFTSFQIPGPSSQTRSSWAMFLSVHPAWLQPKGLQHLIMFSRFSAIYKLQVIPMNRNTVQPSMALQEMLQ